MLKVKGKVYHHTVSAELNGNNASLPHKKKKKTLSKTHFTENLCHLKGSCCIHVGCNDGDASVGLLGVAECEGPSKIHLKLKKGFNFI